MLLPTASNSGLKAFIIHKEEGKLKPILHVLRMQLPWEINYSQIGKEHLGIIYVIKKFHKYVLDWEFILRTDYRPL